MGLLWLPGGPWAVGEVTWQSLSQPQAQNLIVLHSCSLGLAIIFSAAVSYENQGLPLTLTTLDIHCKPQPQVLLVCSPSLHPREWHIIIIARQLRPALQQTPLLHGGPNPRFSRELTPSSLFLIYVFLAALGLFSSCGKQGLLSSSGVRASRCCGFSRCRAWAPPHEGSGVVLHRLSCSVPCGIVPDQGANSCPLHWQVDSQPWTSREVALCGFYHLIRPKLLYHHRTTYLNQILLSW